MKTVIAILSWAVLTSCQPNEPAAYSDEQIQQLRAENPGMREQCIEEIRKTGSLPRSEEECFELLPAQHWQGLWNAGWEWSNFCPAPAEDCAISSRENGVWLEFADGAGAHPNEDGLYRMEFVGRRTKYPGHFGHMGGYAHWVIVDRVIKMDRVKK